MVPIAQLFTHVMVGMANKAINGRMHEIKSLFSLLNLTWGCLNVFLDFNRLWFFKDLPLREQKWNTMRRIEEESEQSVMKQHDSTAAQEPDFAWFPLRDQDEAGGYISLHSLPNEASV